jgi:hypothetical protein
MAAMLAGLVLFVITVEALRRGPMLADRSVEGFELVRIIFYFVAIAMVFVINIFQGFTLKAVKTDDIEQIATKLLTVTIFTAALAETPIILGLVLFVVWGYHTDFYILGFVSLYLMIRHFPYYRQWEKFARDRMKENWPSSPVAR